MDIKSLLRPKANGKSTDRRVWGIPLQGVWLPFFTASNTVGDSSIPAEALGAPVRLATDSDGTPRFSKSGRPVMRVVKELSDQIRIVRENFTAGLLAYAVNVQQTLPDEYMAQVEAAQKAGAPLIRKDVSVLEAYVEAVEAAAEKAADKTDADKELVAA